MDHEERKPNVTLRFGQPKQSLVMKISLKDWEIIKKESTSNPPGGEIFEAKFKKDPISPKRTGVEAPCPDKFQLSDSRFPCGQCDYVATQNGHLKRHKVSKHSNITVECEQCQMSLKPNNMTRHMKEVHKDAKELNCDQCNFVTFRLQHLKEHIGCKHGKVKLLCDNEADGVLCKYSTAFAKKLEEHKLRKHLGVPRICQECGFKAHSRDILYHHMNREHKKLRHQCILCDKSFTKNTNLKLHIKSVHVKETEKCEMCKKFFKTKSGLRSHMQSKHLNKIYICVHCKKGFQLRNSRERHIKSVHLGEKSKCVHCEKEYNDPSALRKHYKKSHNTVKEVEDCNN